MSGATASRVERRFEMLRSQQRGGLVTFITAGDPDPVTSAQILGGLAESGADIIEIGMPFSDPMADGPAIQAASQRALDNGMTLTQTLSMVKNFRATDQDTPIILMGYYNPIYRYGSQRFINDAKHSGVDGLIIVDLPPEEDSELCLPACEAGIHWIRLVAPTTSDQRLERVLTHSSGFIYYVSITGITGTQSAAGTDVEDAIQRLRKHSNLPIAIGFGITTPEDVAMMGNIGDAAVVGSALVNRIEAGLDDNGNATASLVESVLSYVRSLEAALRPPKG